MPLTLQSREAARRAQWATRALLTVVLIGVIGFGAVCARTLLQMRKDAWRIALQAGENVVATVDSDIARNIEVYDLSLRAVATNIVIPETERLSKPMLHLVLFDHAATAHHFGAIRVFDRGGNMILDSSSLDPEPADDRDADFFKAHLRADAGLFISAPRQDARGEYAIYLSRRIERADGSFFGVVVGSIKVKYFHDIFRRLNLDPEDSLTLMNRDGTIVMRRPFDIDTIGRSVRTTPVGSRVLTGNPGWFEDVSTLDGVRRLYVPHASGSPLVILLGRSVDAVYRSWREEAATIALVLGALAIVMVGVSYWLWLESGKRAALQEQLGTMAARDGLTGLANRRQFDDVIDQEWRRGAREQRPVALLMIDIDRFKSINDRFGHLAGDRVLKQIADCVQSSARRAGDCVARYGGEELAVILPGYTAEQARGLAEKIRLSVEALPADPASVTVSIGVASRLPAVGSSHEDLIAGADAAMYAAKVAGRNQISVAGAVALRLVG